MPRTIYGTSGADRLTGTTGTDLIKGSSGDDTLSGGAGADTLYGGRGKDVLTGGDGADLLYGGSDIDRFVYAGLPGQQSTAAAADRIADFSRTDGDHIDLSGLQLTGTGAPAALRWGGSAPLAWGAWTANASGAADQQLLVDTTGDARPDLSVLVSNAQQLSGGGLAMADILGLTAAPPTNTGSGTPIRAVADTTGVTENAAVSKVSGALLANDTGGAGPLTVTAITGHGTAGAGLYGGLTWSANGSYTYTLNNTNPAVDALNTGGKLTDSFTYTVSDGHGGTASSTLSVVIQGSNDAPKAGAAIPAQTVTAGAHVAFTLPNGAFTDVDNAGLSYTAHLSSGAALPSWLSFDANAHSFSGTAPATAGSYAIAVAASDGLASASQNFNLTVAAASAPAPASNIPGLPQIAANTEQQTRFFADDSPWNTKIAAGATYTAAPELATYANKYADALTSWDPDYPSVAIYYAKATDPVVQVRWIGDTWSPIADGEWQRWGNSAAVDNQILSQSQATNSYPANPYSTQVADRVWNSNPSGLPSSYDRWSQTPGQVLTIHAPAGAHPASDGDGYTVIVQPDGTALEMYSPIVLGNGTWVSEMYSFTDALHGMGVGAENGRRASMVESYAGAITDMDMAKGSIDHALAINVPAAMLKTAFTGPALAFDSQPNYTGKYAMGTHFALPANLDLGSLGLDTHLGQMIADAAQQYGFYIVDRGGDGITVATQYAPSSAELADYDWGTHQDLSAVLSHAAVVTHDGIW